VSKPVVPGQTTPESVSGKTKTGDRTVLSLQDGTRADWEPTQQEIPIVLGRESNSIDLKNPGLQTSGSMRVISYQAPTGGSPLRFALTIPAKEVGNLDLNTVNVARVGDVLVGNQVVKNQITYLPVRRDASGNLLLSDVVIPVPTGSSSWGSTPLLARAGNPQWLGQPLATADTGRIEYVVTTFQDHLNWKKEPGLVRMIPDSTAKSRRHVADKNSPADQRELKKPIVNVIILVHGHNEQEKGGDVPGEVEDPWAFPYKRDVWTEFYDGILKDQVRLDCTAFYEFIYPTYRPIFAPIKDASGNQLDIALAKSFKQAIENEAPLKALNDMGAPYNLFIVAHSMGGLVARAGIQDLSDPFQNNLRRVVTWGTPHRGSPLVTLVYALKADPPYPFIENLPEQTEDEKKAGIIDPCIRLNRDLYYGEAPLKRQAMDTPGERDLRLETPSDTFKEGLNLGCVYALSKEQRQEESKFNLQYGTWLYSENTRRLNANDRNTTGAKYTFIYGIIPYSTSALGLGAQYTAYLIKGGTDPKGNIIDKGRSDGAVPFYSMTAEGLFPDAQRIRLAGAISHEDYFSPLGAELTTNHTVIALNLKGAQCDCSPVKISVEPKEVTTAGKYTLKAVASGIRPPIKRIRWWWLPKGMPEARNFQKDSGVRATEMDSLEWEFLAPHWEILPSQVDVDEDEVTVILLDTTDGYEGVELGRAQVNAIFKRPSQVEAPYSASPRPTTTSLATTPTATPRPSTVTPLPPTATSRPLTVTPLPPTATSRPPTVTPVSTPTATKPSGPTVEPCPAIGATTTANGKIGPFTFSIFRTDEGDPFEPRTRFPEGVPSVHGFYTYEGVRKGTQTLVMWCRNGMVYRRNSWSWDWAENGSAWSSITATPPAGDYELRVYLGGYLAQYGKFTIEKQSPGSPSIGTIRFAEGQKDDNPVNMHAPSQSFKYGIKAIYAFFEIWYAPKGSATKAEWYRNGTPDSLRTAQTSGGVVELWWESTFHKDQSPLERGTYELKYYIDNQLVKSGTVVIQ
jgi:hypothetical protein